MTARAVAVLVVSAIVALGFAGAFAAPIPEAGLLGNLAAQPCTAANEYEQASYAAEGWSASDGYARYPGQCRRLSFVYGPITIKPGQNDIMLTPVTIEKPAFDGYMIRFKPDMVRADGSIPPIEQIHLHHATWLNLARNYGDGIWPFLASGEEKTIFSMPKGYGLEVLASDTWQLNYMIHNQTPRPDVVWVTYELDIVPKADATALGLKPAYPIWMDVRPSFYPVFNVQRKYGRADSEGRVVCTWPAEKCADFDPWGKSTVGQGQPGNGSGRTWSFPSPGSSLGRIGNFRGGSLIWVGGHVHPGGLSVQVDLARSGAGRKRIFTSEAKYWSWTNPGEDGGPPTSWDMSMTAASLPKWGVEVHPGDSLIINATYDASVQASYENMGIIVGFITPHTIGAGPGADPFTLQSDTSQDCASGGLTANPPVLCDKGLVTHGHMEEAANHGGPAGQLTAPLGQATSLINIANFTYLPGGFGLNSTTGIPKVSLGQTLRFNNLDVAADIFHSITSCAFPCTGGTGIAFPLADGKSSGGSSLDFDSGELGYGPQFSFQGDYFTPAKNTSVWDLQVSSANGFNQGSTYTFFCRVHPFMRGAFAVQ